MHAARKGSSAQGLAELQPAWSPGQPSDCPWEKPQDPLTCRMVLSAGGGRVAWCLRALSWGDRLGLCPGRDAYGPGDLGRVLHFFVFLVFI